MQVIILESESEVTQLSAELVVKEIQSKPDAVLGLATGSTPIATYRELIRLYQQGKVSFRQTTTFNLDEYVGITRDNPQSYRTFMDKEFFSHINIDPERTHLPNGMAADLAKEAEHYDSRIQSAGGIDLQLLGIGQNGHIGFNEPTSSLRSRTRVKTLTVDTTSANKRFFRDDEYQPTLALTMGIGTILESKKILLLATGEHKAAAVRDTIEGPLCALNPASALQQHNATTIILDRDAAHLLEHQEYYQRVFLQAEKLKHKMQAPISSGESS